jgi:hypothetical protein
MLWQPSSSAEIGESEQYKYNTLSNKYSTSVWRQDTQRTHTYVVLYRTVVRTLLRVRSTPKQKLLYYYCSTTNESTKAVGNVGHSVHLGVIMQSPCMLTADMHTTVQY